jgi:putative transposase
MRLVYTDILFYSILVYLIENDLRRGRHVVFNLHVQLLVNYPPKVAISSLVNSLKGVSSRLIRKKQYPSISK